jgi:hypothetical protein
MPNTCTKITILYLFIYYIIYFNDFLVVQKHTFAPPHFRLCHCIFVKQNHRFHL